MTVRDGDGLRVAVTGAAGFIGRAVVERIESGALGHIGELRLNDLQAFEHQTGTVIHGSYAEPTIRDLLVADGLDVIFHLASLPGGAAEKNPSLGKTVNLDGSIALLDAVAGEHAPVVVYASSIAVLGRANQPVDETTALRPSGSYGAHKAMIEFYLADLTRRRVIDGRTVRPAGIVARPRSEYAGFATAWMSDLFHAALDKRDITIPARMSAHVWLQSVGTVADNIIHAALMPAAGLSPERAWTLPATLVRVEVLIEALRRRTGHTFQVEYSDGPTDQPPLDASAAMAVGFVSDGDTEALVDAVLSQIESRSNRESTERHG